MLNRYIAMFILVSFSHMVLSMGTPPESPKSFGVHTDLNSFLKMLQQSPQRVAAVTAFLTRIRELSQAAKKGASVRVVTQPYALRNLVKADRAVQGLPGKVHDKLYFVRGKDGHGHGFMGSANLTNNQFNNHETVLSWKSPDRILPGFTRHFAQLLPDSDVCVRQRQSAMAARLDALFEGVDTSKVASAFPWLCVQESSEELDEHFADSSSSTPEVDWSRQVPSETPPSTPQLRKRSGGRKVLLTKSGGKRARSDQALTKEEGQSSLKKTRKNQLRPDLRGFSRRTGASTSPSTISPLRLWEGSPSTRLSKMGSTKRCEMISSFDFKDGDLIPWLGHRIKEKQKHNYLMSTMSLNHPELIAKIQKAARAGSTFKILVDKRSVDRLKSKTHSLFQLLEMPNIEVRFISGGGRFGSQHSKVFTRKPLDGKTPGLSVVSTANFTKESSARSNYLLSLPEGSSKKESFEALETQFLDRWNKASAVSK